MSLLNKLIEQAKKPIGILGVTMVSIMNSAHKEMTVWGLSHLVVQKDATVLDVGCGGGLTLKLLSNLANEGEVVGVDYSEDAVKKSIRLNKEAVDAGLVWVEHGDVEKLSFEDDRFNLITAVQTHYFWPNMRTSISEIHRVLKPGGTVMVLAEDYKMNYHMRSFETSAKLRNLMMESGFSSVDTIEKNGWMCLIGQKPS